MLDLKRVREDLQGTIARLETRGGDFSYLNKITELDEKRKNIILEVSFFFCLAIILENNLSVKNNNKPPQRNPRGTITYGKKAMLLASLIAGASKEK